MNWHPPIPITFVLEELHFGGTQRQTLELARRLDRRRFAPRIWTLWQSDGPSLLPQAQAAHVPVTCLTTDNRLRPARAVAALWRALRRERPPLLHLCTSFPNVWGRILGRMAGVPAIVASCRGQGNVAGQHEWALHRLAHAHICNARSIEAALRERGVPAAHLHFIPNGVDTDHFSPEPALPGPDAPGPASPGPDALGYAPNGLDILCVGRLVPVKDHATLLEALALVRRRLPARLHLVGDGPVQESLRQRAEELGLAQSVIFHGADGDVRRHMRAAAVVALASRAEGMPNVLLEAMACGAPVVATRVGGVPDVVEHGRTGLLVAPGQAAELAAALEALLTPGPDGQKAGTAMGQAGREAALRDFSLESMVRRHEAVYAHLTGGGHAHHQG